MSTRRQIPHRRLLLAGIGLALAALAVSSLLPGGPHSASRSSLLSAPAAASSATGGPAATRQSPAAARSRRRPTANASSGTLVRASSTGPPPLTAARRAYAALLRHFGIGHGLFSKYSDDPRYAGVWSLAQAMDGAMGLVKLPGGGVNTEHVVALFHAMRFYWDGSANTPGYDKAVRPPLGPGGHKFYDDNALVGLTLIRAHELTRDPAMLARAAQVFAFEKSGWDRNPAHPFPGGVFWKQSAHSHDRNTVSTAGAAELGLHLYLLTGNKDDLDWAIRMYDWVNSTLRAPNGLYWDHVGLAGRIDKTLWSYIQGLMLGDSTLLYQATGDQSYLQRARNIAKTAVAYFRRFGRLDRQRPIINAIFFANLLELDRLAPSPAYLKTAEAYAAYLQTKLDRQTGVLRVNPQPFLLDQAALVQINAYIALARRGMAVG
jgi:hypothetical protein